MTRRYTLQKMRAEPARAMAKVLVPEPVKVAAATSAA